MNNSTKALVARIAVYCFIGASLRLTEKFVLTKIDDHYKVDEITE